MTALTESTSLPEIPAFRYDVFISYRHLQPDKGWADWLVRALETYLPPRDLRKDLQQKGQPAQLKRVFRDEDEASAGGDLSRQLKMALDQSRYLVVICSRNTPGSKWVNQEVEYFESLGRASRVLPLLVEGDPSESFPAALRDQSSTYLRDPRDETATDVEPLAADVRPVLGLSPKEVKRRALLRLVAGALGVRYDDLYRRDRQRRRRRQAAVAITFATLVAAWVGWFAWTRTDAYQARSILRSAPQLLASTLDDDAAAWCQALVLSGRIDAALAAADATGSGGGAQIKAFLGVADALATVGDHARSDRIAAMAIDKIRGFKPSFRNELSVDVAERFAKRGNTAKAVEVAIAALADSTAITDIAERVRAAEKLSRLIVEWRKGEGLNGIATTPLNEAVVTIAAGRVAAKSGQMDLAYARMFDSFKAASGITAPAEAAYIKAYLVGEAAAAGLSPPANVLQQVVAYAKGLSNPTTKSHVLRQAVQSFALLGQVDAGSSLLGEIVMLEERDEAITMLAAGFARTGKNEAAAEILAGTEGRDELDRYSVLSAIGEGLADGGHAAAVSSFDVRLEDTDKVELRVIIAERLRAAGKDSRDALERVLEAARSVSDDTDVSEQRSRIVDQLIALGRTDEALSLAREIEDAHSKTFSLIAVARARIKDTPFDQIRPILEEAMSVERTVAEPDLVAAGLRETGRLMVQAGQPLEAKKMFLEAFEYAAKEGEYGSSTIADVSEELARLGDLRLARVTADRYCGASDRIRVYAAILTRYSGREALRLQ